MFSSGKVQQPVNPHASVNTQPYNEVNIKVPVQVSMELEKRIKQQDDNIKAQKLAMENLDKTIEAQRLAIEEADKNVNDLKNSIIKLKNELNAEMNKLRSENDILGISLNRQKDLLDEKDDIILKLYEEITVATNILPF